MDLSHSTTNQHLSDAFAGESMANRKYLFFVDIATGTPFEDIPDDWSCPICGAEKKSFVPYVQPNIEPVAA